MRRSCEWDGNFIDHNHVNMIKQLMVNINFFTGDEFSEKDENDLSNEW